MKMKFILALLGYNVILVTAAGVDFMKYTVSDICFSTLINSPQVTASNVPNILSCAILCENYRCNSFTWSSDTCSLFAGYSTSNTTCNENIQYAVREFQSDCTVPVSGIRLCNGNSNGHAGYLKGRVEIFYGNQWGTVCDDMWENSGNNAKVVCNLFGFGNYATNMSASFGQGTGPILLDDIVCTGQEKSLADRTHSAWGTHNCGHGEDVGVTCF